MRYRITFAAGLAVGYVLGARAGRRRYEQITRLARRVADSPAAQETAGLLGSQVTRAGRVVRTTITERVPIPGIHDFLDRPSPQEEAELAEQDGVPEPRAAEHAGTRAPGSGAGSGEDDR